MASTLTLPDQAQITIYKKKWIVPLDANEGSKLEHHVDVSQVEIVDWIHALIDYLCYNILPEDPKIKD